MGYTGKYDCPVDGCDFSLDCVAAQGASARMSMLAHGLSKHKLDWNAVSNETFLPAPVETPAE